MSTIGGAGHRGHVVIGPYLKSASLRFNRKLHDSPARSILPLLTAVMAPAPETLAVEPATHTPNSFAAVFQPSIKRQA